MENSIENSAGVKIPRKSRSLDLQSLYKSGVSKEGRSKKKICEENHSEDVNKKKKRKSRKEVPLSHFDPQTKKNKKEPVNEVTSESESKRKSSSGSNGLNDISLVLGEKANDFKIPRRPRGSVGRKKLEINQDSKQLGFSNSVDKVDTVNTEINKHEDDGGPNDEIVKVDNISAGKVGSSKVKRRVGIDEVKESRTKAARRAKEEDCVVGVNDDGTSSEKRWSNIRKRKHLTTGSAGSGTASKKTEPLLGSLVSANHAIDLQNDDDDDDDEENLEQNAARMLSSRFDPSCTGFSSKSKSDVSRCANGFPYLVSSARDMVSREANSSTGVESASVHTDIRNLRPRKEHKGKRISRKRRHFYEIFSGDLNAYWVLNRRIKVFWPLDETWYYGLVSEYDSESKLHHINYDDKDEEWINLQNEKFKLLLLPSEVPISAKPKKPSRVDKFVHKGEAGLAADNDSSVGTYLDSEPIISWLARSSRRVKPSPSPNPLKKQKTMQAHLPVVSRQWSADETDNKNKDVDSSESERSQMNSDSALPDDSDVAKRVAKSRVGTPTSFQNRNPVVYMRKRFRNKSEGFSSASRNGKARESSTGKGKVTLPAPVMNRMQSTKGYKRPSGCVDFNKPLCSINFVGDLRLSTSLISSKRLRYEICLPVMPFLEYLLGKGDFWLSHTMLLLQHGAIVTASPPVTMEMLFVDSVVGLRFLLFEGCLKQAVALIFLILTVFNQPAEQRNVDMQLPETSIRFRLSCIQDLKKQHLFAFYSFSKLKSSKWLCLDSKLLQHCVLMKRLLVSECTYDNIKALEHESFQLQKPCVGLAFEDLKKKAVPGILPIGVSRESCKIRMSQAAFNFSSKLAELPPFAFSFTAAPAFFMTLHLKLLMDQNFASVNLQDHDIFCTPRTSEISCQPTADDCTVESCLVNVQDKIAEHNNVGTLMSRAPTSVLSSSSEHELAKDVSISNVGDKFDLSGVLHKEKSDSSETIGCSKDFEKNAAECIVQSLECESNDQMHEQHVVITPKSITSPSSNPRRDNGSSGMSVEVPSLDQIDTPLVGRGRISRQISDVGWNTSDGPVHSPNPTGPRSSWQRGRSSSSTAPFEDLSPVWYDGKGNFMVNGFSNGPKKPRTQVQYTLPFGGYDVSAKQKIHNQRVLPCKRIRRANEKRVSDGSRSSQRNLELLACGANVLVTLGDKGWREYGAQVVLELSDHNEWRLAIKLSGITKYSFKVQHILQPGSTNRYTHAMMWKGGKDWVLEFPDRSQWMLFKEMHEECYNRNIRAASVKNIPIPGVRLIEESDICGTQVPFVRNPLKYFQQVQTDVEMAMDSSRILYDMDSDDEQWLMTNKQSLFSDDNRSKEIPDELFEKTMDMLEKVSYVRHRNHFTYDELEELMAGIESKETAKVIYEHWRQKRERMGMPLIRQLQPPLWESYEQQLKEWEHAVARGNTALSAAFQENVFPLEKPPMFAFCLKPRGLDVPNKGSKQRSHRKFPASGYNHTVSGDQYGLHASGRRLSGFAFGDQRGLFPVNVYDSVDASPLLQASTRVLSPRDAGGLGNFTDVSEWNRHTRFYNNKPKKHVSYSSYNNQHTMASYNKRTGNINGVPQPNTGLPEWLSQKPHYFDRHHRHGVEQLDGSDLREFRLRDASGAAQHARNMAKLKREKAQRLLYRADLAIHKAVVALMTADAIKAASNSNGSG